MKRSSNTKKRQRWLCTAATGFLSALALIGFVPKLSTTVQANTYTIEGHSYSLITSESGATNVVASKDGEDFYWMTKGVTATSSIRYQSYKHTVTKDKVDLKTNEPSQNPADAWVLRTPKIEDRSTSPGTTYSVWAISRDDLMSIAEARGIAMKPDKNGKITLYLHACARFTTNAGQTWPDGPYYGLNNIRARAYHYGFDSNFESLFNNKAVFDMTTGMKFKVNSFYTNDELGRTTISSVDASNAGGYQLKHYPRATLDIKNDYKMDIQKEKTDTTATRAVSVDKANKTVKLQVPKFYYKDGILYALRHVKYGYDVMPAKANKTIDSLPGLSKDTKTKLQKFSDATLKEALKGTYTNFNTAYNAFTGMNYKLNNSTEVTGGASFALKLVYVSTKVCDLYVSRSYEGLGGISKPANVGYTSVAKIYPGQTTYFQTSMASFNYDPGNRIMNLARISNGFYLYTVKKNVAGGAVSVALAENAMEAIRKEGSYGSDLISTVGGSGTRDQYIQCWYVNAPKPKVSVFYHYSGIAGGDELKFNQLLNYGGSFGFKASGGTTSAAKSLYVPESVVEKNGRKYYLLAYEQSAPTGGPKGSYSGTRDYAHLADMKAFYSTAVGAFPETSLTADKTIWLAYEALPPELTVNYWISNGDGNYSKVKTAREKPTYGQETGLSSFIYQYVNGSGNSTTATSGSTVYKFKEAKASGDLAKPAERDYDTAKGWSYTPKEQQTVDLYYEWDREMLDLTIDFVSKMGSTIKGAIEKQDVIDPFSINRMSDYKEYFEDEISCESGKYKFVEASLNYNDGTTAIQKYPLSLGELENCLVSNPKGTVGIVLYYDTKPVYTNAIIYAIDDVTGKELEVLDHYKIEVGKYCSDNVDNCNTIMFFNDRKYEYTGYAERKNADYGNFAKTQLDFITIPDYSYIPGTSTVILNLYYKPYYNVTVKEVDDRNDSLLSEVTYKNAIYHGNTFNVNSYPPTDRASAGIDFKRTEINGNESPTVFAATADIEVVHHFKGPETKDLTVNYIDKDTGRSLQPRNKWPEDGQTVSSPIITLQALGPSWYPDSITRSGKTYYYTDNDYLNPLSVLIRQQIDVSTNSVIINMYYRRKFSTAVELRTTDGALIGGPFAGSSTYFKGDIANFNEFSSKVPGLLDDYTRTGTYYFRYSDGSRSDTMTADVIKEICNQSITISDNTTLVIEYGKYEVGNVNVVAVDADTNKVLHVAGWNTLVRNVEFIRDAANKVGKDMLNNATLSAINKDLARYEYSGEYVVDKRTKSDFSYTDVGSALSSTLTSKAVTGTQADAGRYNVLNQEYNFTLYLFYEQRFKVNVVYVDNKTNDVVDVQNAGNVAQGETANIAQSLVRATIPIDGSMAKLIGFATAYDLDRDLAVIPTIKTPVSSISDLASRGVLSKANVTQDYTLYLFYQNPYKVTYHYLVDDKEVNTVTKSMGNLYQFIPIASDVPETYTGNGYSDALLGAWKMTGAKEIAYEALITNKQQTVISKATVGDGYSLSGAPNKDADIYLYYRSLTPPGEVELDYESVTVKEYVGLNDNNEYDFKPTGSIYDYSGDDAVGSNLTAKTYSVEDTGIAGGDLAESTVDVMKYGATSSYTMKSAVRTLQVLFIDEAGRTIGYDKLLKDYKINQVNYFSVVKAKEYGYTNNAIALAGARVTYNYASLPENQKLDNIEVNYQKGSGITGYASLMDEDTIRYALAKKMSINNSAILDVKLMPDTEDGHTVYDRAVIAIDTTQQLVDFDSYNVAKDLVSGYTYETDTLSYVNPYSKQTVDYLSVDSEGVATARTLGFEDPVAGSQNRIISKITSIPVSRTVANQEHYTEDAAVQYEDCMSATGEKPAWGFPTNSPSQDIELNNVVVHTPVVIRANATATKLLDQSISDPLVGATVATPGSDLVVDYSLNGTHKGDSGYKTRDYAEYTDGYVYLKFPFEIYYDGHYYGAGTVLKVPYDKDDSSKNSLAVTIPRWVKADTYQIQVMVYASNAQTTEQRLAISANLNREPKDYVAVNYVTVTVQGNLYGLEVYDVTDYPLWENVFRKQDSLDFKEGNNRITYTVGRRNWLAEDNGHSAKYTLPILYGSHPNDKDGALGRGYAFRYSVKTTGAMSDNDDKIVIKPTFYWVSKDGTQNSLVDVYYDDTINGKFTPLIKVGSEQDLANKHYLSPGDKYLGIPEDKLAQAAAIDGRVIQNVKASSLPVYSYGLIEIPSTFRIYTGDTGNHSGSTVDTTTLLKSEQTWYSEYCLPSSIHVVQKDFDLSKYAGNEGIDYSESFWKKDGYLVVNFEIQSWNGGMPELSYNSGLEGTVNMFKQEGFMLSKSDSNGATFNLNYGDVVFYDLSRSSAEDYKSSGTH